MVTRLGAALAVAALVALTGLSLNRVYSGALLAGLVAGAAALSALISTLPRRVPAWFVAMLSVGAMAAYALWSIGISARAGGVPGGLGTLGLDAGRNALPRLLTALIPVEPQPDTVLAPVILSWLAGFAGTELAVRAARPAAALVPPTLLYAGVLVIVGPHAPVTLWQPLVYAALSAIGLVAASSAPQRPLPRGVGGRERALLRVRTAGGVAAGLGGILAAVVAVSPLVARGVGEAPADPRRLVQPPSLDVIDLNPLIRLAGWAAFPEQDLFQVEIPGDAPTGGGYYDTRLRLAVLPDWDGVTWHIDADYRNAGHILPPVVPPPGYDPETVGAAPARTIEQRITIADLRGRLLPAIAAPMRIEGIRVAYDKGNGALLNNAPLTPGTAYTVTSVAPYIDPSLLIARNVPDGEAVAQYLRVGPTVPDDLRQFAQNIAQSEASAYLRAFAVQTFMREHYAFAADAPSGHGYPNLSFFLLGDPGEGGQVGTSEQFAAAFAALGRLLGLPTRVVVGFHVPAGGGMVSAGDAVAWPEVLFEGIGWVPFDPLPPPETPARPVEPEFLPPSPPTTTPAPDVTPSTEPPSVVTPTLGAPDLAAPTGPDGRRAAAATLVAAVVVAALALVLVAILRALRARRRLGSGDPAGRVIGAWDEVLDSLLLAGHPPPHHLGALDVAGHAAAVVDQGPGGRRRDRPRPAAPDLSELARTVNAAVFGGHAARGLDEAAADRARSGAIDVRRALRRTRSPWRRLVWWLDPRPLWRRRR